MGLFVLMESILNRWYGVEYALNPSIALKLAISHIGKFLEPIFQIMLRP